MKQKTLTELLSILFPARTLRDEIIVEQKITIYRRPCGKVRHKRPKHGKVKIIMKGGVRVDDNNS